MYFKDKGICFFGLEDNLLQNGCLANEDNYLILNG